jgi:hypothetical protein
VSRSPKPIGPAQGFAGEGVDLGDPAPAKPYAPKVASRAAVPDRSREPVIGPCAETRFTVEGDVASPAPRFTDELRSGVEMGTTRGNSEAVPKSSQEYGDSVREARGVRTRPVRPGQYNYG